MRVALVVDGEAEYRSMGLVCEKLREECGQTFLRPVKAVVDPVSPAAAIARMLKDRILDMEARRADLIVVLIDRETRDECPGDVASAIRGEIQRYATSQICVVLKDRMYENWLVADVSSLARMRARFNITRGRRVQIEPNRADGIDALELLRLAAKKKAYDKVADGIRIMRVAEPSQIAANSRSFRRFLRCVRHPAYSTQSRLPA